MLLPIENEPRDYAWGRRGAISALLGRPATDAVEAELWLGAHAGSSARIAGTGQPLAGLVPELPFLLKVLAVAAPLSLQAHPTAEQAREGHRREDAMGIPLDAPERNYKDVHPKPELVVAVTRFEALSGFRPAAEAAEAIGSAAGEAGAASVRPLLDRLGDDAALGDALVWLLAAGAEARAAVEAVSRGLVTRPAGLGYAARIAALHPGDPGVVGALLLHHVVLEPGEALYLPAGNVHAYLDGIGIELMAPSDNVLRGGLTAKHVDVGELGRVLRRAAGPVPLLAATPIDGGALYAPEGAGFSLALLRGPAELALAGPLIALCTDGEFELTGGSSSVRVGRGDAVLALDAPALRISGAGALYAAR